MFKKIFTKFRVFIFLLMTFILVPQVALAKTNKISPAAVNAVICDDKIKELVAKYWKYIIMIAPVILIIISLIEFLKAIMSSDAEALNKSIGRTIKRVIALLVLFLVPVALRIIFTWFGVEKAMCY